MNTKQGAMHRVKRYLAGLLISGTVLMVPAAAAVSADLKEIAANPHSFLGQQVEIEGDCVKGGRKGDVIGYECTTDGGVYVDADDIEPEAAKEKLGSCSDESCRATIRFVPHSFTTSSVIEPGKSIVVFNTDKAELSF